MLKKNQRRNLENTKYKSDAHLLWVLKTYGFEFKQEDLWWDREAFLEKFLKQQGREYYFACQRGEIHGKYTPTHHDETFVKPDTLVVGKHYHISWASKWGVFVLEKIIWDKAYLNNPVNKREHLLVTNKDHLRCTRRQMENHS